jgi:competence CoiA-like predicted nuclease
VPIHLEYHLPEVGRIADVAQLFPNGWIVVHEIQLAGITTLSLTERTQDYMTAGCDVIWYLGNNADTPANREWAKRFQGFIAHVELEVEHVEYNRFRDTDSSPWRVNHGAAVH